MDDCWLTESRPWHGLSALRAGLGHVTCLTLPEPSLLPQALDWCRGRGLRPWPLGGGTNLVGSDRPDAGLAALRLAPPADVPVPEASGRLTVSVGMALGRLVARTAQRGWGGLAALSGIPGTLGGALAMNAGALGREMADAVEAMAGGVTEPEYGDITRGDLMNALPATARIQLVSTTADAARALADSGVSRVYQNSLTEYAPAGDVVYLITDSTTLASLDADYTVLRDYGDVFWAVRMNINDLTNNFTENFTLPEAPQYGVGRRG